MEDYLHKATQEAAAQFILQPQYTNNSQNICEMVITNALQSCSKGIFMYPDEEIKDVMRVSVYCG